MDTLNFMPVKFSLVSDRTHTGYAPRPDTTRRQELYLFRDGRISLLSYSQPEEPDASPVADDRTLTIDPRHCQCAIQATTRYFSRHTPPLTSAKWGIWSYLAIGANGQRFEARGPLTDADDELANVSDLLRVYLGMNDLLAFDGGVLASDSRLAARLSQEVADAIMQLPSGSVDSISGIVRQLYVPRGFHAVHRGLASEDESVVIGDDDLRMVLDLAAQEVERRGRHLEFDTGGKVVGPPHHAVFVVRDQGTAAHDGT